MKVGIVAGAFDLLHAGHIHLFKQCKKYCDSLIVAIQVDPSKERKDKNKPIESIVERHFKVSSCKYVNRVIVYETEEDLSLIFRTIDIGIRFLGFDYLDKKLPITDELIIPIKYINSLSIHTSDIRERICKS